MKDEGMNKLAELQSAHGDVLEEVKGAADSLRTSFEDAVEKVKTYFV